MMTKEENEILTQTGPGSPCGEMISDMVPDGGDWKEYTKTLETEARARS